LIKAEVLSAIPSINARLVFDAPIDIRNIGITEYTILTEVSVRKLVRPVNKILRLKPRYPLRFIQPWDLIFYDIVIKVFSYNIGIYYFDNIRRQYIACDPVKNGGSVLF